MGKEPTIRCVVSVQPVPLFRGVWSCSSPTDPDLPSGDDGDFNDHQVPNLSEVHLGGGNWAGGRPLGSCRNTRSKLEDDYTQALAETVSAFGVDDFVRFCQSSGPRDEQVTAVGWFVRSTLAEESYRGQVWALDAFMGAVARFSNLDQHKNGDPEVVSCWVAPRGNIACSCVDSTRYESMMVPHSTIAEHATCGHAVAFLSAHRKLASVMNEDVPNLSRHCGDIFDAGTGGVGTSHPPRGARSGQRSDDVQVFDTGGIPIAVVISGSGVYRVPAPVKCARKATSCCYCDS